MGCFLFLTHQDKTGSRVIDFFLNEYEKVAGPDTLFDTGKVPKTLFFWRLTPFILVIKGAE
jgi:hypothetical protein